MTSERSSVHSYREQSNKQPLVIFTFFGAVIPQCVGLGGISRLPSTPLYHVYPKFFIRLMFLVQKGIWNIQEMKMPPKLFSVVNSMHLKKKKAGKYRFLDEILSCSFLLCLPLRLGSRLVCLQSVPTEVPTQCNNVISELFYRQSEYVVFFKALGFFFCTLSNIQNVDARAGSNS